MLIVEAILHIYILPDDTCGTLLHVMLPNAMLRRMFFASPQHELQLRGLFIDFKISQQVRFITVRINIPIMFGPPKFPCRRVLSVVQGSFYPSYPKHPYYRINIVDICRQKSIQCSGVRGYANTSSGIKETKPEDIPKGSGVASGELVFDRDMRLLMLKQGVPHLPQVFSSSALKKVFESIPYV